MYMVAQLGAEGEIHVRISITATSMVYGECFRKIIYKCIVLQMKAINSRSCINYVSGYIW